VQWNFGYRPLTSSDNISSSFYQINTCLIVLQITAILAGVKLVSLHGLGGLLGVLLVCSFARPIQASNWADSFLVHICYCVERCACRPSFVLPYIITVSGASILSDN